MNRLADLIDARAESLLARWVEASRSTDLSPGLSELRAPDRSAVLRSLVSALRGHTVPTSVRSDREERERRGLRALVVELARDAQLTPSLDETSCLLEFFSPPPHEDTDAPSRPGSREIDALIRQLEQKERELRLVIDTLPVLISFISSEERYGLVNRTYQEWFGVAQESLRGRHILDLVGEAAYAKVSPYVRRALAGEALTVERYDVPYPNAGVRDVKLTFVPRRDAAGQVEGIVALVEDISERRRLEQERERLAAQRTEVLESMGDAFFALDSHWRVTLVNRHYERLTRQSRDEVIGALFWEMHSEAARPGSRYVQEYQRCMTERVPVTFVDYDQPLDLWTDVRAYPTSDGGISVFFRDVSVERMAQELLRTSEERYRSVFESMVDAFCILQVIHDEQGEPVDYRILQVNPAYETHTGLRDAVGKTARELVPGIDGSWARNYARVVATGQTERIENYDPAMDRWFEVYASRVGTADLRQVALLFKDVSERKRAEQQRERLINELAKSNAALDQFAYITSHDLKAPLRGIASLTSWIEEDLGDSASDETRQNLQTMRGRVQRLEGLINGILNYSTAGRSKNRPESVEVGKMLADIAELQALPTSVTLTVGEGMPTLLVERVPFQQVFMNLIGNSVKYAQRPDPVIQIEASDEGAFVHFRVIDNGPGIAPEFHERIWGLFQKLESRSNVEGTGIGLSVVKKIIESRGGKTWVESALGQGTTFHVVWPRHPVSETPDPGPTIVPPAS